MCLINREKKKKFCCLSRTCAGQTGPFLDQANTWQSLLLRLPAGGLQSTDVAVRLPVGAAHLVAKPALADALGERLVRRVFAFKSVPAPKLALVSARLSLSLGAHQATVATVRHVATGATGARTGTHIAPRWTCGF